MQLRRAPYSARQVALRAILGEIGCTALFVVLLATGGGLLLDFQLTGLHPIFSTALMLLGVPLGLYWAIRRTLNMDRKSPEQNSYMRNLALAAVAGQSGCSTVILIFLALFAGLFLDAQLDTHPIFSVGLVLICIPFSLYAMIRLVLSTTAKIAPPPAKPAEKAQSMMSSRDQSKENGP
jgi:F0F1-type ATP synthase assembly protein I